MVGIVLFVFFLGLIFLGAPISIAMGVGALVAAITGNYDISSFPLLISNGASNYTLVAIPYFVLLGNLMTVCGVSERMFDFADACIGHIKGGLAQVNILASVIFAGVSGTSSADNAGLGLVEINEMTRKGYDKSFSSACTIASAVLGPIIPPSVTLLIFGSITGVSVAKLFIAGILPGILVAFSLCATVYYLYVSGRVSMPVPTEFSWHKVMYTIKHGFFALLSPAILLYTMVGGIVTPTEAGIIGIIYALFLGLLYKELTIKKIIDCLYNTMTSCALIMFLIGLGSAVGWFLTAELIPQQMSELMLSLTSNKYLILLIMNIILLILGMFMDGTTIQIIMVPILLPIIDALAISRIQFGVMLTINILIGTITPPFGTGLFITSSIANLPMEALLRALKPFFIPLVIALICITYIPFFTTWLPSFF